MDESCEEYLAKRNVEGDYEIRSNTELIAVFNGTNKVATFKSQRLNGLDICMEERRST